jgi:type 2 lantibiotic biosynthesis protein LanM
MYSWLQRNKNKILNSQILEKFYYTETRFVFRPTNNYNSLLKKITNPSLMRDGAELSIQIDSLCKVLIQDDSKPLFWSILHEEKCALEKLNFPLFTSHPNTVDLVIKDNKLIEKYFKLPSIDFVTYKLKNFNDEDLKDQVYFIRFSLCKESILKRSHSDKIITSKKIKSKDFTFQKTHKYWQKSVDSLIDNLENSAVYLTEKYITWLVRQYKFLTEQFDPLPISYNFFEGLGGIAFLLTSYNQIIKDNHYEQLTRATLVTCQEILKKSVYEKINQDIGIGIGLGTTSLIYYCTHIAHLANDKEFEKIAKKIALTLTIQNIESDRKFDIILGSSGTILGLLNLYKLSNNSRHIEQAIICGNHLLNNRVSSHSGKLAWETFANKINTGFSHGVAGIAYALLRLYKVTGDNRYKEAAEEAIAYERSVFIPELNNWPDFRQPQTKDNPKCMCSWCHGAPGIGLARVATLDILDTPEIRQDIEAAITTTLNYGLSDIDHLCCGNMGRVEFLFTAGRKLNRPELVDAAMKLASQVVARAEEKGHYGYGPILDFHPGFFQGASGIGYQLLRLAYPDQLPSVLLWE